MSSQDIAKSMIDRLPSDKMVYVISFLEEMLGAPQADPEAPKAWDQLSEEEIAQHLAASEADIRAGRVYPMEEVDARMCAKYHWN